MDSCTPRACVVNLGCRVNRVESDWMETAFVRSGAVLCPQEQAQIVAINTCAVTGEAQAKTRKAVRHAAGLPSRPLVAVTGCVANLFPEELEAIAGNVRVFRSKATFVHDALDALRELEGPASCNLDELDAPSAGSRSPSSKDDFDGRAHGAFRARRGVKVQDGCDNRCTYCIVWRARGNPSSTPYSLVEAQVRHVLGEGALEVDLTGVNLGRYAAVDASGDELDLAGLVERLAPLVRSHGALLRASSIEPPEVSQDLVEAFARNADCVAPHFHLPLQAGSDDVLRRMGRHYDAEGFLEKVSTIRGLLPAAAVSTDIIVGFPGETEEDFAQTLEVARLAGFSKIHAFRFSARPDTPAASMPCQVEADVVRRRSERLRVLAERLRREDAACRVGTAEPVLVERLDASGMVLGTTASHHEIALRPTGTALAVPSLVQVGIEALSQDGRLVGTV